MSRLRNASVGITAAGALAVALVGAFEGLRTKAYIPIPGDVPTICFGATRGVKLGDTATVAQCKALLVDQLGEFETNMRACLKFPDSIPVKPYAAFLSLSYNIGSRAFCGSTVARKANAYDYRGACDAITAWNKAGGKVIPGLMRRRMEERKLCLEGLE